MEEQAYSKSEKKRRFKAVEAMAQELVALADRDLARLPCAAALRDEIRGARPLKAGARKRQIKYIAKLLRQESMESLEEMYDYLEERKGSLLKKSQEFHDLEWFRDAIINEALANFEEARHRDEAWEPDWPSEMVALALEKFPGLDPAVLKKSAWQYARSRNPLYSREIFRTLKAASQRLQFA